MQTRKGSFVESWANIFVGGSINWLATILIVPNVWNPNSPKLSAMYMTFIYTGISLVRSYLLRRYFNGLKFGTVEVAK